jgi:hypothetical protein
LEDNIKIKLIEICEDVDWIQLAITALPPGDVNPLVWKPKLKIK